MGEGGHILEDITFSRRDEEMRLKEGWRTPPDAPSSAPLVLTKNSASS